MKIFVIALLCFLLLLTIVTLMIPATRTGTRTVVVPTSRERLFQIVTNMENQTWRPSVKSVRVIKADDGQEEWTEVSQQGHELMFKTVKKIEPELFEIEFFGSPSISGRWVGKFTEQSDDETRLEVTETVTSGHLFSKVLGYLFFDLEETMDMYIRDLQNKVKESDHEQTSNQ
jgi:hypothetical protein